MKFTEDHEWLRVEGDAATVAAELGGATEITGAILSAGDIDFYQFEALAQGEWSISVADQLPRSQRAYRSA